MSANILEVSRVGSHEVSEALVSKRTTRKAEREEMEYLDKQKKKKEKEKGPGHGEGEGQQKVGRKQNQTIHVVRKYTKKI